jgi:hypothetical protein
MGEAATKSALRIAFQGACGCLRGQEIGRADEHNSRYMGTSRVPEMQISDHIWSYNVDLGDRCYTLIGLKSYTYMINRN